MSRPIITLKNVKIAHFASHETPCFEATIYVDGKRFCGVSNNGQGGCDDYYPVIKGESGSDVYAKIRRLEDCLKAASTPEPIGFNDPRTGEPMMETPDLCILIYRALDNYENAKRLKSMLRREIVAKCNDGIVRAWRLRVPVSKMSDAMLQSAINRVSSRGDVETVLNAIPFDRALDLYIGSDNPGLTS